MVPLDSDKDNMAVVILLNVINKKYLGKIYIRSPC